MNTPAQNPANFHILRERLRLQGLLTTRTALHIGSGAAGSTDAMDLPVLRDAQGLPFIPGASIKGVVRSTLESLLRAVNDPGQGMWACDPLASGKDGQPAACGWYDTRTTKRAEVDLERHCAACWLLGSHLVASHVRFSDALLTGHDPQLPAPISVRDGVAIDRDLRTVHGGQKYDFEVVNPGAAFALELFVDNPEPWRMGLLLAAFEQIAEGFSALGGFTSRGLGRVELAWTSLWRIRAAEVLAGQPPTVIEEAQALEQELGCWRDALARQAEGGR